MFLWFFLPYASSRSEFLREVVSANKYCEVSSEILAIELTSGEVVKRRVVSSR